MSSDSNLSASEREADLAAVLSMAEVLRQVLTDAALSPSELLEHIYYAGEPELARLIRLVAALEPEQRAQACRILEDLSARQPART